MLGIGTCCCPEAVIGDCCLPFAEQFQDQHKSWRFRVECAGAIDWTEASQMPGDPCYGKIFAHGTVLNGVYPCEWHSDHVNSVDPPLEYCDTLESWYVSPKQTHSHQDFENGVEVTRYYHMFALVRLIWSPIPNPNPLVYGYWTAKVGHAPTEDYIFPQEPWIWRQTIQCCDDDEIECGPTTHYDWPDCQPGRVNVTWN